MLNDKILNACGAEWKPRVLTGNKCDLRHDRSGVLMVFGCCWCVCSHSPFSFFRQVSQEDGKALAQKWEAGFTECSAKVNNNICECRFSPCTLLSSDTDACSIAQLMCLSSCSSKLSAAVAQPQDNNRRTNVYYCECCLNRFVHPGRFIVAHRCK